MRTTYCALAIVLHAGCEAMVDTSTDAGGRRRDRPTTEPTTDECGDLRPSAILDGITMPTLVALSGAQLRAIALVDSPLGTCSGVLVAPSWLLTARHCSMGLAAADLTVKFGSAPSSFDVEIGVAQIVENPMVDVTLLELESPAAMRGVGPVRVLTTPVDRNAWVGRMVEIAGYGVDTSGADGTRRFGVYAVSFVDDFLIDIGDMTTRGACNGDSGGPLFVMDTDGSVRVAGVLSLAVAGTCVGRAHYSRVDRLRAWIERSTGPTPAMDVVPTMTTDPCVTLGQRGMCVGNEARWCSNGEVRSRDCDACGQDCAIVTSAGGAYCT